MTIHYWNNHKIEVVAHALARYIWCVLSFNVKIDNKYLFESPKQIRIKETINFNIENDNELIECKLVSIPPSSLIYTRYKIFVDDKEIATGKTVADNWYLLYGLLALWIVGVLLYVSIT